MHRKKFIKACAWGSVGISNYSIFANIINSEDSKIWKWSKEGMFYKPLSKYVKCLICPKECILSEGKIGECRNRINSENKLYSIAYGNPCAINIDPVEKSPLYHFLPSGMAFSIGTAGCSLSCLYCQNWHMSQMSPSQTKNYDLFPEELIAQAKAKNCDIIALTYSEPTTSFEYTFDISKLAKKSGLKTILVSNGYINEQPLKQLIRFIDAANIDLKAFNNDVYKKLTGGKLEPVLNALKILKDEGVWLEISNLLVPSWTDNHNMIKEMCKWLYENGFAETPLHFGKFYPAYKLKKLPPTPISTIEAAKNIALQEGLKFVYISNVKGSDTTCPNCDKVLIRRQDYRIIHNHITNNTCSFCGEPISGIWE